MEFSDYQKAVFDWTKSGEGHAAVNAVAGSGKTFTGIHNLGNIPKLTDFGTETRVFNGAFNKTIAVALTKQYKEKKEPHWPNVTTSTYNSLGFKSCIDNVHKVVIQGDNDDRHKTAQILRHKVLGSSDADFEIYKAVRFPIQRLVSLCKGQCCFSIAEASEAFDTLIDFHDLDVPGPDDKPVDYDMFRSLFIGTYHHSINTTHFMDFDDQIFQPLKNGWKLPQYDWVCVDEYQDTNEMQDRLLRGLLKKDGRMLIFGDPDQAIYDFRGATPDAMGNWVKIMQAKELPLSICYRCPIQVVKAAQSIVPRIEWAPGAKEGFFGEVDEEKYYDQVEGGDFVICRIVSTLISDCLRFIGRRQKAQVLGRDVGDRLVALINQVTKGENINISLFADMLTAYHMEKTEEFTRFKKDFKIEELNSKVEGVRACMHGEILDTSGLKDQIDEVFTEAQGDGITLMTAHKCKGLQNPRVWIREPEQLNDNWHATRDWMKGTQRRLRYVAFTRAENECLLVRRKKK